MRTILFALLLAACEPSYWEGIPAERICPSADNGRSVTCIAGGQVYFCVHRDSDHMVCAKAAVETRCVNLVNAETVCPGVGK